jgi:hypothetical protein
MATKQNTKAAPAAKKRFGADKKDLISAELTPASLKKIEDALAVLEAELGFIPNLSREDREGLAKPGARVVEASYSIVDLAEAYPQYIHQDICDPTKLREDLALDSALSGVEARALAVVNRILSGRALAQSDIQRQASGAYALSRIIPDEVGVNALVEPMKQAMARHGRSKKEKP